MDLGPPAWEATKTGLGLSICLSSGVPAFSAAGGFRSKSPPPRHQLTLPAACLVFSRLQSQGERRQAQRDRIPALAIVQGLISAMDPFSLCPSL